MTDTMALLREAAAGEQAAWNQIIDDHHRIVWSTARDLGLNRRDAADVSQTVWLHLVESLDTVPDDLPGWLEANAKRETARLLTTPSAILRARRLFAGTRSALQDAGGRANRTCSGSLTAFAVLLAGGKRATLREEWQSHLAGELGKPLTGPRLASAAIGFVIAGLRFRARDLVDLLWRPLDAVLRSRRLSNLVVWIPTVVAMRMVVTREGISGLVFFAHELVAVAGTFFGLIRLGRWWRGVQPVKHEPPRSAGAAPGEGPEKIADQS